MHRNKDVRCELYKPYAFFESEEVREQVAIHILSLSTVDYTCFSENYGSIPNAYKIAINTSKYVRYGLVWHMRIINQTILMQFPQ